MGQPSLNSPQKPICVWTSWLNEKRATYSWKYGDRVEYRYSLEGPSMLCWGRQRLSCCLMRSVQNVSDLHLLEIIFRLKLRGLDDEIQLIEMKLQENNALFVGPRPIPAPSTSLRPLLDEQQTVWLTIWSEKAAVQASCYPPRLITMHWNRVNALTKRDKISKGYVCMLKWLRDMHLWLFMQNLN